MLEQVGERWATLLGLFLPALVAREREIEDLSISTSSSLIFVVCWRCSMRRERD